ncbi:hypothetical protein HHI36_005423 [Cryptolaemus montrouzieri]|uniref:Corticotropin-releasing factor domain-containing protein n=1 Tax=Cryptolaemus montrouzieri TaxID=559131 RepID=A0ABD2NUE7_9CUCU
MRLPIYLICAALILAIEADDNPRDYYGSYLEPMNVAPERESLNNYLLPKVPAKYKPEWIRPVDQGFYLVTDDMNNDSDRLDPFRRSLRKREYESIVEDRNMQPSLSIKAPIDVLRKTMYQRNLQRMVERNRNFLNSL